VETRDGVPAGRTARGQAGRQAGVPASDPNHPPVDRTFDPPLDRYARPEPIAQCTASGGFSRDGPADAARRCDAPTLMLLLLLL